MSRRAAGRMGTTDGSGAALPGRPLATALIGGVLAACGSGPGTSGDPPPAAPAAAPEGASLVSAPEVVPPRHTDLAATVEAALDAAAARTGLPRSALRVVSSEAVTWTDGSLGCPEPGMNYTMALVPGYRVVIEAAGERLDFHASDRGYLMLCPPGRGVAPSPGGTT